MEEWVRFGWAGWQDREEPEPRVFVISILIIVNKRGKVVCDICTFKESTYSESPHPFETPISRHPFLSMRVVNTNHILSQSLALFVDKNWITDGSGSLRGMEGG